MRPEDTTTTGSRLYPRIRVSKFADTSFHMRQVDGGMNHTAAFITVGEFASENYRLKPLLGVAWRWSLSSFGHFSAESSGGVEEGLSCCRWIHMPLPFFSFTKGSMVVFPLLRVPAIELCVRSILQ